MAGEFVIPSNVLWIRMGAFGDVLQAVARARLFKRRFPDACLTMLSRPEYGRILAAQDCFDDLILWDNKRERTKFPALISDIRKRNFDHLVSVHNAGIAAAVSMFSGIKRRYGYNSTIEWLAYDRNVWEWFSELGIDKDLRDVPMMEAPDSSLQEADSILSALPDKKIFCIIGASKPQKVWPMDYWPHFLSPLIEDGWGVVLNGHGQEEAMNAAGIIESVGSSHNILNLVDKLDFLQMCAVVKKCSAAVGPDTGPLHLAALAGTPTLGLFGCTPSQKIGFTMPWFREVLCTCPDVGCWNYNCPKPCMSTLTPVMALYAFNRMTGVI